MLEEIRFTDVFIEYKLFYVHYTGHVYSLIHTCAVDSALFALYFIYLIDANVARHIQDTCTSSPYQILLHTFDLVQNEGWDAGRIHWLLKFNVLKQSDQAPKDLFGSVDEYVFNFLKHEQRYTTKITCSRYGCTKKERYCSSTEIDILQV